MLNKMNKSQQPFSKINFLLIGCCCILIIVGFLLMIGGGSSVEGGFNPDIFSTRRIVVGPLLAFLGFALMAFAIFFNPEWLARIVKREKKSQPTEIKTPKDGMA